MITSKQESVLLKKIKSLSELEFTQLMEEVAEHVNKNKWNHVIDSCFGVDDFSEEISTLEEDMESLEDTKQDLEGRMYDAFVMLDNLEIIDDDLQNDINKIKDKLS